MRPAAGLRSPAGADVIDYYRLLEAKYEVDPEYFTGVQSEVTPSMILTGWPATLLSIPRLAGLVLAAGFIVTSVTLSTMAFFRSQYSLRSVAITRFQGDGGFRELSSNVVIPTHTVFKVPLVSSSPFGSTLGLWEAPAGTYSLKEEPQFGRAMGVLLTGAARISPAGSGGGSRHRGGGGGIRDLGVWKSTAR
ncbi:hypothetical protein FNF29_08252 [Cafeteria roenbergensis]|uniref:Uncharacterized protein n=1 Tax=Cafeteria roenbergensis TaxID=33653 RepID=A0A5A8C1Y2_CAFRO|nr:hypothetical protein FNF29_08252 [Cafeteria roenbergensis]|eukprot:KAA0146110.1 hypothetical protein FNF29_08252 [Cafeteria roenbergensis]